MADGGVNWRVLGGQWGGGAAVLEPGGVEIVNIELGHRDGGRGGGQGGHGDDGGGGGVDGGGRRQTQAGLGRGLQRQRGDHRLRVEPHDVPVLKTHTLIQSLES